MCNKEVRLVPNPEGNSYYIYTEQVLGQGTFAMVYLGSRADDKAKPPTYYAVKVVNKEMLASNFAEKGLRNQENEVRILKTLKHENIINLADFIHSKNHYYLVFEYCQDVLSRYLKATAPLSELEA